MRKKSSRSERLRSRAELNRSKALKRKWLVFLILTLAACGIGLWVAFK